MKCLIDGKEFDPSCREKECLYDDGRAEGMVIFENPFDNDKQYLMFSGSEYPTYRNWPKPEMLTAAEAEKILKIEAKTAKSELVISAIQRLKLSKIELPKSNERS